MFCKLLSYIVVAVAAYLWFVYVKHGPIYKSNKSLRGKTVLFTGGNAGIGKTTCFELAKKGARIIIASRNIDKSEQTKKQIIKKTGNNEILVKHLDLSDFDSVRQFAKEFIEEEKYLDYLINNAGALSLPGKAKNGLNKIYAINHFGHFLLTNLLLDKMKSQAKTRPVRIINVSAHAFIGGKVTDEMFYSEASGTLEQISVYMSSKLANIYFTEELHRRLKGHKITTYSLHPGVIRTEILDDFHWITKLVMKLSTYLLTREPIYGSQTILYCALDDEVVNRSGEYFSDCGPSLLYPFAIDRTAAEELWEKSVKITKLA